MEIRAKKPYPNMEIPSKNNIQIWKCKNTPYFAKKTVLLHRNLMICNLQICKV